MCVSGCVCGDRGAATMRSRDMPVWNKRMDGVQS